MATKVYRSLLSFQAPDDMLKQVAEAVSKQGMKEAKKGNIARLELSKKSYREDIVIGDLFVIPASVCKNAEDFPYALLASGVWSKFNQEEKINATMQMIASEGMTKDDLKMAKDMLFKDAEGEEVTLIAFQPAWGSVCDVRTMPYNEETLFLDLRDKVFAAPYNPALSNSFEQIKALTGAYRVEAIPLQQHVYKVPTYGSAFPELEKGSEVEASEVTKIDSSTDIGKDARKALKIKADFRVIASSIVAPEPVRKKIRLTAAHVEELEESFLEPEELGLFNSLDETLKEKTSADNKTKLLEFVDRAIAKIEKQKNRSTDPDYQQTMSSDISDWKQIRALVSSGSMTQAARKYQSLDTASKEHGLISVGNWLMRHYASEGTGLRMQPDYGEPGSKETVGPEMVDGPDPKKAEDGQSVIDESQLNMDEFSLFDYIPKGTPYKNVVEALDKAISKGFKTFIINDENPHEVNVTLDPVETVQKFIEDEQADSYTTVWDINFVRNEPGLIENWYDGNEETESDKQAFADNAEWCHNPNCKKHIKAKPTVWRGTAFCDDNCLKEYQKIEDNSEFKVAEDKKEEDPLREELPMNAEDWFLQDVDESEAQEQTENEKTSDDLYGKKAGVDKEDKETEYASDAITSYQKMRDKGLTHQEAAKKVMDQDNVPKQYRSGTASTLRAMYSEFKKNAASKKALTMLVPGQVLEGFYPDLNEQLVYQPAGREDYHNPSPEELQMGLEQEDSGESTKGPAGLGLGPSQSEGVPLKKEMDLRGPGFGSQFYAPHDDINPATLMMRSSSKKTAADGGNKSQLASLLKLVCGQVAASLTTGFSITQKPMFTDAPVEFSVDLAGLESYYMPSGVPGAITPNGFGFKALAEDLNDTDFIEIINGSWAQAAIWNKEEGGFVYEVFVRAEKLDLEEMVLTVKYVIKKQD